MNISIIDAIIVLMILMGAIVGFKNGAIKEGTKFIGLFLVIIISFILKDKLMVLMYENLPFFNFFGLIKGLDAINILFYQLVSFLIVFAALMFILKVLLVITGLIEWLLKLTIFLSIPSKILGIVVGALEYYVYLFIALYILNMPIFGLTLVSESKLGTAMLENTPILSELVNDTVNVYTDVWSIIKNRGNLNDKQVNTYVLATLLDNKLITIESARELVESNYIIIEDNSILDKYNETESLFEELGGCLLLGGCDGDNSLIKETYKTNISKIGESGSYEGITYTIKSITDDVCIKENNCNTNKEIEIELNIDTGFSQNKMTITTNGQYRWIKDTIKYIFAKIENGKIVVGIAEYKIKEN